MRSGTSFFNGAVFKKTVLRYWPVWAAYSVIWLVALPIQGLMMLQMDAQNRATAYYGSYIEGFAHSTADAVGMSLPLAVVFGALCAMAVCSHLYNARSANFFGSLPVRREALFATHYLAGLAFLLVPTGAVFLLTLLVEAAGGAVFLPGLGFWLAVTCGECLLFYSMAVFCGMFTGHILALPAFYVIFNALATVLISLAGLLCGQFLYGFAGFEGWVEEAMRWLTPVAKLEDSWSVRFVDMESGWTIHGLDIVAVYAAVAIAMAAGSFFLYRARRLESAGDVVSVKCMRPVFKYGVSFCAGLTLGMVTASVLGREEVTLIASVLVWAVIGYFAAQMLLDKSFRVFKKWKGAAVMAGVFALLFCAVGFDLTGFETRVPRPDQVEYVAYHGGGTTNLADGGDYLAVSVDGENPEALQRFILLHQAAVEQRDGYDISPRTTVGVNVQLFYQLKNGSTLSRRYYVYADPEEADQEGSAAWVFQQMYGDRELYWKGYGFEEAERRLAQEDYRLREAACQMDDEDNAYYGGRDAQALYEAVKEDFQAGRIGVRRVEDWAERKNGARNLVFQFSDEEDWGFQIDIRVQDTASSTLAVLAELEQEGAGSASGESDTAPYTAGTEGQDRTGPGA